MAGKYRARVPDPVIVVLTVTILAFGLVMIMSASSADAYRAEGDPYFYFFRQMRWAVLGFVSALAVTVIPYRCFRYFAGIGILFTLFLFLLLYFSPYAETTKGATRWLKLFGVSVQPSEIAKLTIVLFLAYILTRRPLQKPQEMFLPLGVIGIFLVLVYKQPDLGTTMIIAGVCCFMLLQTELKSVYFLVAIPLGIFLLYQRVRATPYQWDRVLGWLQPWSHATKEGLHNIQCQLAFANGGVFGVNIGRSEQKYNVPESYADSIFAITGEEFGLLGTLLLVALYVMLIYRCYYLTRKCPDMFGRFLAFGLITTFALQAGVNMAVVTGLFPITGLTLPLVSYGGSSLVITMVSMGMILNVTRYCHKQ